MLRHFYLVSLTYTFVSCNLCRVPHLYTNNNTMVLVLCGGMGPKLTKTNFIWFKKLCHQFWNSLTVWCFASSTISFSGGGGRNIYCKKYVFFLFQTRKYSNDPLLLSYILSAKIRVYSTFVRTRSTRTRVTTLRSTRTRVTTVNESQTML